MSPKTIAATVLLAFVAVSVGYLVVSETRPAGDPVRAGDGDGAKLVVAPADTPADALPAHKVIAYYFHNTQRCPTCLKIERLAEETLRGEFAGAIERGELEWRVLNMEEPPNEHFVTGYELVTSSLVVVDVHAGQEREWVNMERVWELVGDDEAGFRSYVTKQVREYLES